MEIDRSITPAEFLEVFGPALEGYLEQTYGKEGAYVLDLLPQSAEFFSVSYHAVSALRYAGYTSKSVDVSEEEAQ
jgi:hypothetical protein